MSQRNFSFLIWQPYYDFVLPMHMYRPSLFRSHTLIRVLSQCLFVASSAAYSSNHVRELTWWVNHHFSLPLFVSVVADVICASRIASAYDEWVDEWFPMIKSLSLISLGIFQTRPTEPAIQQAHPSYIMAICVFVCVYDIPSYTSSDFRLCTSRYDICCCLHMKSVCCWDFSCLTWVGEVKIGFSLNSCRIRKFLSSIKVSECVYKCTFQFPSTHGNVALYFQFQNV